MDTLDVIDILLLIFFFMRSCTAAGVTITPCVDELRWDGDGAPTAAAVAVAVAVAAEIRLARVFGSELRLAIKPASKLSSLSSGWSSLNEHLCLLDRTDCFNVDDFESPSN